MANYNLTSFRNTYILTDQTGSLFDSGGPTGSYSSGQNYYVLIAPQNTTGALTLNVISGAIDSSDALRIYDGIPNTSSYAGLTVNSSLLAVLSGTLSAQTITASSGRAYIRFGGRTSANTIGTLGGFQLDWTGSGIQTVDSSSGVIRNQYGATFPQETYMTFAPGMFTGSTTLPATKDILVGFWARYDYDSTSPLRGLLTIGDTGTGLQGLSIVKTSTTSDLRFNYRDSNGAAHSVFATNMLLGGGATTTTTAPPQWHHYGFLLRRTSTTGSNVAFYRDGAFFTSASSNLATAFGSISSSLPIVLAQYRTAGVISAGQSWTGSFDDVFLATVDTGSTPADYANFFAAMYNSGNWVDPTVQITSSFPTKNGSTVFNWRFEETGSMLNTRDWGSFGNIHSASTMVTGGGSAFLTPTASGMSYTPYASLAYSASAVSKATVSFNTGSAAVYENTSSYVFNLQVTTASVGQSATASISFGGSDTATLGTNYTITANGVSYTTGSQLPIYLSWSAGDTTTKYITASIIDNTTYTGTSSSFTARILTGSSTNITLGSNSSFTLNILDYEEGNPSFTSASYSTGEASGSVLIYVDRLSGSQGPLSVNYSTVNGTAISGTNYTTTTGTFSWADGNSSRLSASIPILFDGIQTSSKNFSVSLFNLSTGSFLPYAVTSSTITIADQEPGTFNWQNTSLSVYETASSATINVTRISGTYGAVTASLFYSSSQGTINPKTGSAGSVTFADGESTKQVTFNITDDLIDEPDDPIYITFSSFSSSAGTAKSGSQGTLILTIIDNETGSVTFSSSSATIYENTASYYVGVERLYGGDQAETASITFIGSTYATSGSDYNIIYAGVTQSSPFNVTWADQDKTTKYITASIINDNVLESDETITFGIASSSVSNIGPSSSFVLTIYDYEITGSARFVTSSYSVSIPGSVTVQVERYNGSDVSASAVIDISSSSTAVAGVDYTNIFPYTVNWANQESGSKNIVISTLSSWGPSSVLNLKFSSLTNLESGSILTSSVAITSTTITKSSSPYQNVSKDYVIYDYANTSYEFTRRTQQVPFTLNKKGTGLIRKP